MKKKKKRKIEKYFDCLRTRNSPQETGKRKNWNHTGHSIVEVSYDTEKSPGHLRKLAVTQTIEKKPPADAGVKNLQSEITLLL